MGSTVSVMLYDKHGERLRPIDIVEASITQEINGEYRAYITTIDKIEAEQIVELEDHDGSLQLFRLSTPSRNLEYYNAQAWHITQDLANDVILNRAWLAQTGAQAWPQLLQAGIHERRFTGTSDIPHVRQLRIVRRNVLESAIGTQDNSFVNRFGGELRRDRYTVDCLTRLGEDRGFRVAVAHNIRGLTIQTDYTQVTNRIIPTVLNEAQAAVELPEIWIDSPNIGLTTVPHTKAIHLGDIWVGLEDDDGHIEYPTLESAYAAARQQIAQMWEDGVDKPSLTVDVDFVQLGQMDQYKDIEELQTLKLGDTVTVVLDDMYYRERMSLYVWDVILKEYRRCVLGKPYNTLVAMHNSIEGAYTKAMDASYQTRTLPMITEARKRMAEAVAQAMGYYVTTVYEPDGAEKTYTHDEPKLEDSMKIEYYPEPGTKVYTNTGWNNGNPTWLYGQVDGSWIVNTISAYGVSADWINAGTMDVGRIRMSDDRSLAQELTRLEILQEELEDSLKIGSKNLALASDEERVSAQYLMTTIDLSEYLRPGHPYSVTVKGRKDVGIDFRLWFNGGAISGPPLEDRGDGLWAAQFDAPLQPPGTLEQDARQIRIYNFPSTAGITPSVIEWVMVTRGDQEYLFHVRAPEEIEAELRAAKKAADDAMELAEANEAILTPLGLQVTALEGRTQQHHGLPPPTDYKAGDRWAIPALTNHDLRFRTNAQLRSWGITNSMLSGGEMLATRGREGAYDAADWHWIATSGAELNRIDRLLSDLQAGRLSLSEQTRLPDGGWKIGNFAIHDVDYSRWQHRDGSYTQISPNPGLEQYIAGRGRRYHNLMYITTVSGQDTLTKWVQLPDEFKGKEFEVFMAVSDSTEHVPAGGDATLDNRSAIRRLVATVSPEATINYGDARVPYMCYKLSVDIHKVINDPINSPWRLTRAIGIMIAIA